GGCSHLQGRSSSVRPPDEASGSRATTARRNVKRASRGRPARVAPGGRFSAARLMGGGLAWVALTLLTARPTPAPVASPNATPEIRDAYERAANEVLCYCGCARQTVRECT